MWPKRKALVAFSVKAAVEPTCSRSSPPVVAAASGAAAAKNGVEAASVYNMATSLLFFLFHRHLTNRVLNEGLYKEHWCKI